MRIMGEKKRILIADDEPGMIQLLKDYFELQGYEVIEASNGLEVLEQLDKDPDIILLDVNMPMLDGFEVCVRIRADVSCPIVFLSGRVGEADRIRGLMLGGDDYILKPVSMEELGARVNAHLRREERRRTERTVRRFGGLVIHYEERSVCYRKQIPFSVTKCGAEDAEYEEVPLNLTKTEYGIDGEGAGNVCGSDRNRASSTGVSAGAGAQYPGSGLYQISKRIYGVFGADFREYIASGDSARAVYRDAWAEQM